MAVLWDINVTRTELWLPKDAHKLAASYVGGGDAAFGFMYEFWFGCIAHAVRTGEKGVELPPNARVGFVSAGHDVSLPEWMVTLLVCTFLSQFSEELLSDDFDPSDLASGSQVPAEAEGGDASDESAQAETSQEVAGGSVVPVTAKLVIRHANALAAAGAKGFLDALKTMRGTSVTPVLAAAMVLNQWRSEDADVVHAEFPKLVRPMTLSNDPEVTAGAAISSLIDGGESRLVEFKSTGRTAVSTGEKEPKVEWPIVRTVAAFMNGEGGTLVVGVGNQGEIVGLEGDYPFVKPKDRDGWELWVTDLLAKTLGKVAASDVHVTFAKIEGKDVARISVPPVEQPVFATPLQGEKKPQFLVRLNNGTHEFHGQEALEYQKKRWP